MTTILKLKLCLIQPFTYHCGGPTPNHCEGKLTCAKIPNTARGNVIRWAGAIKCDYPFHRGEYTATLFNRIIHSNETLAIADTIVPINRSFYITNAETNHLPISYSCVTYSAIPPLPSIYIKIQQTERGNK